MTTLHSTSRKTTRLAWCTDLHLDLATDLNRNRFLNGLSSTVYDAALVTGDIATATSIAAHLKTLAAACHPRPLYFVLGNHDFYGASLAYTYDQVTRLCRSVPNLFHLQDMPPVTLGPNVVLAGHHGWADARCGWGSRTVIESPDHSQIADFHGLTRAGRYDKMEMLARQSSSALRRRVLAGFRAHRHVLIASHVPPFPTTARYDGKPCGDTHLPHFTNVTLGAMLIAIAKRNGHKQISVISGHTHNKTEQRILNNLDARVGGARSGTPEIQEVLCF